MEDIEKLIDGLSITTYGRGSIHWVDLTYIIDPLNFYVRPKKYNDVLNKIGSTAPTTILTVVRRQGVVIFQVNNSPGVKIYVRGWITTIHMAGTFVACDIYAIDYGYTKKGIAIEEVWECDEKFAKIPPMAVNCQLANCYPIQHSLHYKGFRQDSINAFCIYVQNEPAQMTVLGKIGSKLMVSLVNSNTRDIATVMASGAFSQVGSYKDPIAWRPIIVLRGLQFTFKKLENDQTLYVRMLYGKSLKEFYVATIDDYNKHQKEIEYISFYAKRELVVYEHDLAVGLFVCAKDVAKNIYERAVIRSINYKDKTVIVQLVDWGKDEIFHFNTVKYMSSMCLRTPVLAICCSAGDCQFWGDDLQTFLTPGYDFLITIKSVDYQLNRPNSVEIHPLNDCSEGAAALLDGT